MDHTNLTPRKRPLDETLPPPRKRAPPPPPRSTMSGDAMIAKARAIAALATSQADQQHASSSSSSSSSKKKKKPRVSPPPPPPSMAAASTTASSHEESYAMKQNGVGVRNSILRTVIGYNNNNAVEALPTGGRMGERLSGTSVSTDSGASHTTTVTDSTTSSSSSSRSVASPTEDPVTRPKRGATHPKAAVLQPPPPPPAVVVVDSMGDIDMVDGAFRGAAGWVALVWALLVCGTLRLIHTHHASLLPADYDDYEDRMERAVPQTAFFILLVTITVQMTPLVLSRIRTATTSDATASFGDNTNSNTTSHQEVSGILVAVLVVQGISLATNFLLGWGPRAVVSDPVTGSRVFLFRWCEWIPLSGFMTLLAESTDLPSNQRDAWKKPLLFAACQSASTLCGMVFPYCQSVTQWVCVMVFSWVTFMMIFPRVYIRRDAFSQTPRGRTVLEREYYDRRKFAYYLMLMCSICWSTLVALYTINLVIHMTLPPGHVLRFPSLAMSCDTIADVMAKAVYTKVIVEAYQAVFASDLRSVRQLNELKQLMSALWVSSSDVIVISTKQTKHRSATMLSPSFLTLVGANPRSPDPAAGNNDAKLSVALVLETDRGKIKSAYYSDTSTIPHPERGRVAQAPIDLNHNAVQQALRITNAAWTTRVLSSDSKQDEPLRALSIVHSDPSLGKVMCEMKVSRHTEHTAVAVVRDVTERYRRFAAESRVHAETIARQRDMHTANRFTRHEVKNGLLSSIELCRTLGSSLEELKGLVKNDDGKPVNKKRLQDALASSSDLLSNRTMQSLVDLDGTLHGVLDTVLAEVMAREVVHEVYQPRLEELDVPSTLMSGLGMKKERIPLTIKGGSMPKLLLDAQLVGHIYRNAVSNACKYGKQGGHVRTFLEFDAAKKEFKLEVTNEPGAGHETLMALGESASEFVFAQGVRLQPHMKGKTEKKLDSSGDGAWIMQKCAKTMKGVCRIHFTHEQTKFTFQCPVVPVCSNSQPKYIDFKVPSNVRAIGIDDSKIQRKLLSRILTHVGVEPSRQILLGESPEDVTEFESTLMQLMEEHSTEKFLVIVDEHLVSSFGWMEACISIDDHSLTHSLLSHIDIHFCRTTTSHRCITKAVFIRVLQL